MAVRPFDAKNADVLGWRQLIGEDDVFDHDEKYALVRLKQAMRRSVILVVQEGSDGSEATAAPWRYSSLSKLSYLESQKEKESFKMVVNCVCVCVCVKSETESTLCSAGSEK